MPNQQYYFNPFKTRHDKGIQDTETRYKAKPNCKVISLQNLKDIEQTATLLIDGHSSASQPILSSDGPGFDGQKNPEVIQLKELLDMLVGRLPQAHIKIRLLGCYSGIKTAPALALFLGLNKYKNIVVGGYTQSVFTNDTPKGRMFINLPERVIENTHNSGYVWWFNSGGKKVDKPQIYNPEFPTF